MKFMIILFLRCNQILFILIVNLVYKSEINHKAKN